MARPAPGTGEVASAVARLGQCLCRDWGRWRSGGSCQGLCHPGAHLNHHPSRSENYVIRWASTGVPQDIELLNNLKVVFTVSADPGEAALLPPAAPPADVQHLGCPARSRTPPVPLSVYPQPLRRPLRLDVALPLGIPSQCWGSRGPLPVLGVSGCPLVPRPSALADSALWPQRSADPRDAAEPSICK